MKLGSGLNRNGLSRRRRDTNERHRETIVGAHQRLLRKSLMGRVQYNFTDPESRIMAEEYYSHCKAMLGVKHISL